MEVEDFDIHQGFGPDLSKETSGLVDNVSKVRVGLARRTCVTLTDHGNLSRSCNDLDHRGTGFV